jgi:hypothetical protein
MTLSVQPLAGAKSPGGSSTFSVIDAAAIGQLDTHLQMELPFIVTHRGALHQEVVDLLVPLAATGNLPFQVFSDLMKERRVEHAATAAVQYSTYAASISRLGAAPGLAPAQAAAQQRQPVARPCAGQQTRPGYTQPPLTRFFQPTAAGAPMAVCISFC